MPVPCFTRQERNGMHVLMPLAGRMKLDCMIVNETVKWVFDRLREEMPFPELVPHFVQHARRLVQTEPPAAANGNGATPPVGRPAADPRNEQERLRFDLYRILLSLRDRELCDYPFDELLSLLPGGTVLRGTTQVMPLSLVRETAAFLQASLRGEGDGRPFFCPQPVAKVPPQYFDVEQIVRRHLDQIDVYFVGVDAHGALEACTVIQGLKYQPYSLMAFYVCGRAPSEEAFGQAMGTHLARLCGLLSVVSLSAKLRFQFASGASDAAYLHPLFEQMLGELQFRRSFQLPDELGSGRALVAYDRALF